MVEQPKFPHMLKAERVIWKRFLELRPIDFERAVYDDHVGEGAILTKKYPENIQRMALRLTQKRIDAVLHTEKEIWLMEVKMRASVSALGQLLTYKQLYEREREPDKPVRLGVVCRQVAPDMEKVFEQNNVTIFLV